MTEDLGTTVSDLVLNPAGGTDFYRGSTGMRRILEGRLPMQRALGMITGVSEL